MMGKNSLSNCVYLGSGFNTIENRLAAQAIYVVPSENTTQDNVLILNTDLESLKQNNILYTVEPPNKILQNQPSGSQTNQGIRCFIPIHINKNDSAVTKKSDGKNEEIKKATRTYLNNREIISNTNLFYSLSDLQKEFDISLDVAVPTAGTQIKLDLSNIHKNSTQELYYTLELKCKEKIEFLEPPYELCSSINNLLSLSGKTKSKDQASNSEKQNKALKNFFEKYGDSFVNSITYGRWALVIIQFKLSSVEEQRQVSAKIGQAIGPSTATVGIGSTLYNELQKHEHTIHLYTGGLDYTAPGMLPSLLSIDDLIKGFSVQNQKSDPAQISWTTQPYMLAVEEKIDPLSTGNQSSFDTAKDSSVELEKIIYISRNLKYILEKCRHIIQIYLHALNSDKIDNSIINDPMKIINLKEKLVSNYENEINKKYEEYVNEKDQFKKGNSTTADSDNLVSKLNEIKSALVTRKDEFITICDSIKGSIALDMFDTQNAHINQSGYAEINLLIKDNKLKEHFKNLNKIETKNKEDIEYLNKNIYKNKKLDFYQENKEAINNINEYLIYNNKLIAEIEKYVKSINYDNDLFKLVEIIYSLQESNASIQNLIDDIEQNCFDMIAMLNYSNFVMSIINLLNETISKMPHEVLLPLKRISSDRILPIKHKKGEFQFNLIPPDRSDSLQLRPVNNDGNPLDYIIYLKKIKLKQLDPKNSEEAKPKSKLVGKTKLKNVKKKYIPITTKLSRLYLKPYWSLKSYWKRNNLINFLSHNKRKQPKHDNYCIDIYIHFAPSYPTENNLKNLSNDVRRIIKRLTNDFPENVKAAISSYKGLIYDEELIKAAIKKLKELNFDSSSVKREIAKLDKQDKHDVFDEIFPAIREQTQAHVKILFPYNITQTHWLTGEIIIHKNENEYDIEIYAHDPYGKEHQAKMDKKQFEQIAAAIKARIEGDIKGSHISSCRNMDSPYGARQDSEDGVSCGVITASDLIKRIKGQTLNIITKHYSYGAIELRDDHIKTIEKYLPEENLRRKSFISRNKSRARWYEDDDINQYLETMIAFSKEDNINGYRDKCYHLLNGDFPSGESDDKTRYLVAVTNAVDCAGKALPIDYFLNKEKQSRNSLSIYLEKLLPYIEQLKSSKDDEAELLNQIKVILAQNQEKLPKDPSAGSLSQTAKKTGSEDQIRSLVKSQDKRIETKPASPKDIEEVPASDTAGLLSHGGFFSNNYNLNNINLNNINPATIFSDVRHINRSNSFT